MVDGVQTMTVWMHITELHCWKVPEVVNHVIHSKILASMAKVDLVEVAVDVEQEVYS